MLRYGAAHRARPGAHQTLIQQHVKNLGIPEQRPQELHQALPGADQRRARAALDGGYVEWHTLVQQQILAPLVRGEKSAQEAVSAVAPQVNAILQRKCPPARGAAAARVRPGAPPRPRSGATARRV